MSEIEEIGAILKNLPFFPPLNEKNLEEISSKFKLRRFPQETIIFAQGDPGDFFYILKSGSVKIVAKTEEGEKELARLKKEDFFGEMALLTGEARSATVTTISDVEVLALSKADFNEFLESNPAIALNLSKVLSRRLSAASREERLEKKGGRIISVYSVRERVGKSTLSANLAVNLVRDFKKKVVLLDLDLQFGDLAFTLNSKPERTIFDLAGKKDFDLELIESYLTKDSSGLKALFAPRKIEEAEMIEEKQVIALLNLLKESYDYLIIDTSSTISSVTLAALDSSDLILFLVVPDLLILKNAKLCLELMKTLEYPAEKIKLGLVQLQGLAEINKQKVEETLGRKIEFVLPSDPAVGQSLLKGETLVISKPQANISQSILRLSKDLTKEEGTEKESKPSLLKGLLGKRQ